MPHNPSSPLPPLGPLAPLPALPDLGNGGFSFIPENPLGQFVAPREPDGGNAGTDSTGTATTDSIGDMVGASLGGLGMVGALGLPSLAMGFINSIVNQQTPTINPISNIKSLANNVKGLFSTPANPSSSVSSSGSIGLGDPSFGSPGFGGPGSIGTANASGGTSDVSAGTGGGAISAFSGPGLPGQMGDPTGFAGPTAGPAEQAAAQAASLGASQADIDAVTGIQGGLGSTNSAGSDSSGDAGSGQGGSADSPGGPGAGSEGGP